MTGSPPERGDEDRRGSTDADDDPIVPRGNQPAVVDATDERIIVSAGAGTGKTQTMAWRIERAIEERGLSPGRTLVLTFANEAAHAIRDDLGELLDDGLGYDVDVYTYHSFCHHLLTEYAYYAGLSPEFEVVTEDRRRAIVQSVTDRLEYRFVEPIDIGSGADRVEADLVFFIEELKHAGIGPDEIDAALPDTETIATLSEHARELRDLGTALFDTDRNPSLTDDPLAFADRFERYELVLRHKRSTLAGGTPVEAAVADYLGSMLDLVAELEALLLDGSSDWYERFVPQALLAGNLPPFFTDTYQTPIGRLVAYVEMLGRAHDFVPGYRAYERELRGEGAGRAALDYDDLIRFATELLADDDVRPQLLSRWDAILCDEFQDTDTAQLDLVATIGADAELFVIGDGDQAIYEWRGAHPENVSEITRELNGFEAYDLELNFRSPDAILELAAELPADSHRLSAYKDDVENAVVRVEASSETDEHAEQVSTAVSKLVKDEFVEIDGYDLGDVAVLVRTKWQASLVANQLDEACIPYEMSHDAGAETSPGIETLLSYLRVLVDPGDDVSLARVLAVFYRVPESDLKRLTRGSKSAYATLVDRSIDEFDAPDRIERARSDVETLRGLRRGRSISALYDELKRRTRFEWFLTADERRELVEIERLIETFDEGRVTQSTLTEEFIAYVELRGEISRRETGGSLEAAEGSTDKVDVMTVFQAKGLEFPVVLLPFLSSDHWPPLPYSRFPNPYPQSTHSFSALADVVESDRPTPLWTDLSEREVPEEWRIVHVGITRAKERLFLFGHDPDPPEVPAAQLDGYLPEAVDWSVAGPHMDVWGRLTDAYEALDDASTTDLTQEIRAGLDRESVSLEYFRNPISLEAAIDDALDLARDLRAGDLEPVDPAAIGLETTLDGDVDAVLARRHSHTSLETVRRCPRRHLLDHVLYAFDDPIGLGSDPGGSGAGDGGASPIAIGTLFHLVAEEAFRRGYDDRGEWVAACDRLGRVRGLEAAVPGATRCIDRYFETPVADWERIGAEIPFELPEFASEVAGSVIGEIDDVRRDDGGDLVLLDYKTGGERKDRSESYQLLLYLLAARELFEEPVRRAGYVYVGEAGPAVRIFPVDQLLDLRGQLTRDLRAANESGFADARSGSHCADCPHRSLGCGPEDFLE